MNTYGEWLHQPPLPWHGPEGQVGCTECGRDIIEAATHTSPSREEAHPAHSTGPGLWTCDECYTEKEQEHKEVA